MNPCLACKSEDGPRLLGPINRPFVACECGSFGPSRATAEAAMHAWNKLNPDNSPKVDALSGVQRTTLAQHAAMRARKAQQPAKTAAPRAPEKRTYKDGKKLPRGVCVVCGGQRKRRSKHCQECLNARAQKELARKGAVRERNNMKSRPPKWGHGFNVKPRRDPADIYVEKL